MKSALARVSPPCPASLSGGQLSSWGVGTECPLLTLVLLLGREASFLPGILDVPGRGASMPRALPPGGLRGCRT